MLRISTEDTANAVRFRLEGKLTGAWVAELEQLCDARKAEAGGKPLVLDLKNLTGADAAGRSLLALLRSQGATAENLSPLSTPLLWGDLGHNIGESALGGCD